MKNFVLFCMLSFFIEGVFGESVAVADGDSVTLHTGLHTGLTEIKEDDVLVWRFGDKRLRIAIVRKDREPTIYEDVLGGRFKDRLKPDNQTGDLTITNTTTEHTGVYEISINDNANRTFTVNVVSGVHEVKSVSLTVGDSVSLNTGTIIQRDDVIEWRFGDLNSLIAEHNRKTGNFSTSDGPDGRFRHRLQLDNQTGSLTITDTSTKHSGLYEADIRKSRHTIHKSYSVTARGEMTSALSVMEGDSVTLHTDLTEIQTDDFMQWMFGDTVLAEISKAQNRFLIYDGPDGRFGDRLKLDPQTGSLIITDTRYTDSGLYELKISSSRFIINKRITVTVTVTGEMTSALSVMNGDSVTLHTDLTEIQTYDLMQWMFEDTVLAEINKAGDSFSTSDGPDGRFRDRLKLDHHTRSLIITDIRFTDAGVYELKIRSSRFIINKRVTVTVTGLSPWAVAGIGVGVLLVCAAVAAAVVIYHRHKISELIAKAPRTLAMMEGESVPLITHGIEISKDEDVQWKFRGAVIAKRKGSDQTITVNDDVLDKKFKGRLQLNKDFGYLTIIKITTTDSGYYELWSTRSGMIPLKTFYVSVYAKTDIEKQPVKMGGSVTLKTGVADIKKDEHIQWKFRLYDSPIALITGGTRTISPFFTGWWRFIFRLKLDQDGSLTITRIELKHTGFYELYITADGETTMKLFNVKVVNDPEEVLLNSFP